MNGRWFMLTAGAALLLLQTGCANFHSLFISQRGLPSEMFATCQRLDIEPTKYVLTVNIADQSAALYANGWRTRNYVCSTSRFGIGEVKNSFCTPRGLHGIAEKVGDGAPAGTIFKERKVVGTVAERGIKAGGITTRILWLEGLEPGYNRGTNGVVNVDTHDREIYIHGTGDQNSLGRPASHGCIHFADVDLILLYGLLPSGTLVWITEK
jgi:hypothetical protein